MSSPDTAPRTLPASVAADLSRPSPLANADMRLAPGDLAPDWNLLTSEQQGFSFRNDAIAGHTSVIFAIKSSASAWINSPRFEHEAHALSSLGVRVYAIFPTLETPGLPSLANHGLLVDHTGEFANSLAACSQQDVSVVVLRANNHLAAFFGAEVDFERLRAVCETLQAERLRSVMVTHPPVLLIPDVFSKEECRKLIQVYEERGQVLVQADKALDYFGADYKMQVPEHMREDRIDHFFFEKDTVAFLLRRLARVEVEVAKAFHYRITKHETLRIARYEGKRNGFLHGHRDDIPPHKHRRFALSINLNTEGFDGGDVRFPEFGDQRYRPASGTAFVFSSSLLHEALEVTAGRRFVFLSFMY